jgi:hypothetical protein
MGITNTACNMNVNFKASLLTIIGTACVLYYNKTILNLVFLSFVQSVVVCCAESK